MEALNVTILLTSTLATLTITVIYYQIKTYTYWSSRGIKGPVPFPFVGTNIYLFFKNRVDLDEEWKQKYGRTYGIYEGSLPVLRTSDNELIKFVCIKNFSSITDRNSNFVHSDQMKRWTFFSSGSYWSNQRALITPMFSGNKMRNLFSTIAACGEKFFKEIEAKQVAATKGFSTGSGGQDTSAISISKDETMSLALDTIAKCFFSLNMDTYKDKTSEFYKRAFAFATFDLGYFIIWSLIPSFLTRYYKLDPVPKSKHEFFDKLSMNIINERRRSSNQVNHDEKPQRRHHHHHDMLQNLIEARIPDEHENVYTADDDLEAHYNDRMSIIDLDNIQRELEQKSKSFRKFSDLEISSQSTFFFLAGFETTSSSISFCLYELSHQQESQEEVYQELRANLGTNKQIDYDDLFKFKKLEAFISESLRLYNPVTENTRMVTVEGGIVLPTNPPVHLNKGSIIGVTGLVCHRDQEYWEEPMKFDMSRFYPENKHKIKSCTYHPFGVGPRNCAGMRFALLQIRLLLANLLLKYKLSPGQKNLKYPPDYKRHAFFLQLANTDFRLIPRNSELIV